MAAEPVAPASLLPWMVWSEENDARTKWSVCHHVGDLLSDDHQCVAEVEGRDPASARANADYIVTACNAYPALIGALTELHRRAESYCNLTRASHYSVRDEAAHELRNAIAVARDLIETPEPTHGR
jgi:hypothetical protein